MSIYSHQPMINHHGSGFWAQVEETIHIWRERHAARGTNWRSGPTATCTTSAFPAATSCTRPKSRSGGLKRSLAGAASAEGRRPRLSRPTGACHDRPSSRRSQAIFRRAAARNGKPVTVRFVEPRDAEELQNYFRSLSTRSRYNRFFGAMQRTAAQPARSFHPCRRARRIQRDRDHERSTASRPSSARPATPSIPRPTSSNSACRSTTAGRARASARRCCGISNAAPRRSARSACSAIPCVPTRP